MAGRKLQRQLGVVVSDPAPQRVCRTYDTDSHDRNRMHASREGDCTREAPKNQLSRRRRTMAQDPRTLRRSIVGGLIAAICLAEAGRPAPASAQAYVANRGSGTVSVINTTTNEIVGDPIFVDGQPYRVAVTPNGQFVYVTNAPTNSVSPRCSDNTRAFARVLSLNSYAVLRMPHRYRAGCCSHRVTRRGLRRECGCG